ncbi:MAG: MMPL family transporter [Burkholderiaceae bacterium]
MSGRRAIVLGWLLALAAAAVIISRTPFLADMSVFLPRTPTAEQRLLVENLRNGATARILLVAVDGVPADARARASLGLRERLLASQQFQLVNNGDRGSLANDQKLLFERRYLLSPAVTPAAFETAGLHEALRRAIDELASSTGALTKPLITRDPTGELLRLLGRLDVGDGLRTHDGVWVDPEGRRLLLMASTRAGGSDVDGQQQAIEAVHAAFAPIAAEWSDARLRVSGPGVFAVESRRDIEHDVHRLSLLGSGLIIAMLCFVFRSPLAIGLAFVPMISAVLAGASTVSWVFGSLHGLTLGFGITLIAEAVDYALYQMIRRPAGVGTGDGEVGAAAAAGTAGTAGAGAGTNADDGDAGATVATLVGSGGRTGAGGFWQTIVLGVLTSTIGFSALVLSGFPGLTQMATFSIAGLVAAALATRFVLPALTPAGFRPRDLGGLDRRLHRVCARLRRLRWPAAALVAVALAMVWRGHDRLWDDDIAALNPVSAAARQLDEELRGAVGAAEAGTMIVVTAGSQEAALQGAEQVGAWLDEQVAAQRLGAYESPATLLPSERTQQARRAALPPADVLRARLAEATRGLPLRAERLEPFIDDVQAARAAPPLTLDELADTQLGLRVRALLTAYDDRVAAIIALRAPAAAGSAPRPLDEAWLAASLPRVDGAVVSLLNIKQRTDRLYAGYLHEAIRLSIGGAAIILLLLAASIRSPRQVLSVCAPLLGAVVLTLGVFLLAGHRLNLLHLIGLLLVVAVGSNYTLFFRTLAIDGGGQRRDGTFDGTLASLVFANLAIIIGFGVLAGSRVPLLSALGSTVAIGAALALALACVWAQAPRPLRPPPTGDAAR